MKPQLRKRSRGWLFSLMTAITVSTPAAYAGWGSVRANNRSEGGPQPVRREAERVQERRRLDIEDERRQGFFWGGFHPGMMVGTLPAGFVQVSVGPVGYYYYDGVYYQPNTSSSYSIVAPPAGIIVPQLPEGAEPVAVGSTTYYYGAGAFYLQQPTGFAVVSAPPGVIVTGLPPGSAPTIINGTVYYVTGTNYFMPVMQAGATVYVTAQP